MPKYLFKARFSAEALQGLLQDGGTVRRTVVEGLAAAVGGSLELLYFAFGDDDAYIICDLPDSKAAATVAMITSSTGRVSVTTVSLLTPEELDAIAAGDKPEYTPPGG